ncbi:MAG: LytTR family transcriptional regulator DNA-binding domain-containing protein [Bacteroidota bacterium]
MFNFQTLSQQDILNLIVLVVFVATIYWNRKLIAGFYAKAKRTHTAQTRPARKKIQPVFETHAGILLADVSLIIIKDKCTIAYNRANQAIPWPYTTVITSVEALPKDQYFRIRREVIVRGDVIDRVSRAGIALQVTLKEPFNTTYIVSKKSAARFRKFGAEHAMPWWDRMHNKFR